MAKGCFFAFLGMVVGICFGICLGYSLAQEDALIKTATSNLTNPPTANITKEQKEEIPKDQPERVSRIIKTWDFVELEPVRDKIEVGDELVYTSGGRRNISGAWSKITVRASGSNAIWAYRRPDNELLGEFFYLGDPYIDGQELRPGTYVCQGIQFGHYVFKEKKK